MDRQPTLEGESLLLRPLAPDAWDALFAVASDPQIWAVHPMHDRWQEPVFREFFEDALAQGGALAVIEKDSGDLVGSSRFQGHETADGGSVEIGWTFLARRLWGTGANAEMKRLMLAHALKFVERVDFRVGETNVISRKAMTHIGGRLSEREEMLASPHGPVRHVIYEISRESFAAGPLASPGA
jgi:RimJ/RimL family protein N-acetyltransferase